MDTETPLLNDLAQIIASLKSHKRYSLRSTALVSILVGSVLNFASLLAAFIDINCGNAPRYLTVWTSIVLAISFFWNCVDLASHSDRIFKQKHLICINTLVFVDALGFLSFLALLIANGIIVDDMYRGPTFLMIYNSVPWMFCCAIHGLIALGNMPSVFLNVGRGSTCCRECHHKAKRQDTRGSGGGYQPLFEREGAGDGYQDLEANVTSGDV